MKQVQHIASAQNERLKQLAKWLRHSRNRRECGVAVLEGIHLAKSFSSRQYVMEQVFIPEHRLQQTEVTAWLAESPIREQYIVSDNALSKISSLSDADDVICVIRLLESGTLPQTQDCVVLESVQDPGNVGTLLRSAAAAGVQHIVLSRDCADVWSPKVLRAGMGAHALLTLHTDTDLQHWVQQYRAARYATVLNEHAASLYTLSLREPCAWLFGNEGSGLSTELQQYTDKTVFIPMQIGVESLNVAMAATVCLFEQQRQRLALG
ncbi:TrmH family RNA methyltransferase [Stenoxybacter acetivorans]|uniref:TrmH family RNA methyltransferase n=1 Tax=Stenoxybacter acetivorans TaxID=422441 RepID=UPI0005610CDB|nr:RNA methyltransferase [Stenoxybacter acetivorans]